MLLDLDRLSERLAAGARPRLYDLAHTLAARQDALSTGPRLAIVTTSHDDLIAKLDLARKAIRGGTSEVVDPRGIFFEARPAFSGQKIAFVFPGQGSQAVGMLRELAIHFQHVRCAFEEFEAAIVAAGGEPFTTRVFPPPAFNDEGRRRQTEALRATEVAQPAIGAASVGLLRLLAELGMKPDMTAGHSYGELVALHAAGALDTRGLAVLSWRRGELLREAGGDHPGAMAALLAGTQVVAELIDDLPGVLIVNDNGPSQAVVAGPRQAITSVLERAEARQIRGRLLPVACAFHTPLMEPASGPLAQHAAEMLSGAFSCPVFSNLDASIHPLDPRVIAERLGQHVTSPVRFADMIVAMHDQEARVFVEVGPGGVLTPLIGSILRDRPHLAVAADVAGRPGLAGLLHALARLVVAGLPVRLEQLTRGRAERLLDLESLPLGDGSPALSSSTWMVNGSRARPLDAPEPRRLGQAFTHSAPESQAAKPQPTKRGTEPPLYANEHGQ